MHVCVHVCVVVVVVVGGCGCADKQAISDRERVYRRFRTHYFGFRDHLLADGVCYRDCAAALNAPAAAFGATTAAGAPNGATLPNIGPKTVSQAPDCERNATGLALPGEPVGALPRDHSPGYSSSPSHVRDSRSEGANCSGALGDARSRKAPGGGASRKRRVRMSSLAAKKWYAHTTAAGESPRCV